MTAVTVLTTLDTNGLSPEDIDALETICRRRLSRGIAGHLAYLRSEGGDSYAEILSEPEGDTVFKLRRLDGTYVLSYCCPLYGQNLLAEGPSLPKVIEALPEWPPAASPRRMSEAV
ncbi:MAG: hypothetical protein QNJ30_00825 [Kiloniellales bacterium]|nr:hypothetical protein [Kiloniellales bacterium]